MKSNLIWQRTEAGQYRSKPNGEGRFYHMYHYESWWYCEVWRVCENPMGERQDLFEKCRTLREEKAMCE